MIEAARPAHRDEIGAIADLHRGFVQELASERGGALFAARDALEEPLEPCIEALIEDRDCLVLAGTLDEILVGMAVAALEPVSGGRRLAWVRALYVVPEAREIGVGEALLAAVTTWAAEAGAGGVDVPALPGMRASKNFLEGSGFAARMLVMHRSLEGWRAETE